MLGPKCCSYNAFLILMEATKAQIPQTRKKFPAEQFLLIWHPKGPTYDQKKPQAIRTVPTCFFRSYLNIYGRNLRNRQKSGFFDTLTMIFPKVFIVETCDLSYFNSFPVF